MHVKIGDGYTSLLDVPENFNVIVFGCFEEYGSYFAFLSPKNVVLKPGTKIKGVKYAEGGKDQVDLLENEVDAFRREDGGYNFHVKMSGGMPGNRFQLFPDERGESTHQGCPVKVISFRLAH